MSALEAEVRAGAGWGRGDGRPWHRDNSAHDDGSDYEDSQD